MDFNWYDRTDLIDQTDNASQVGYIYKFFGRDNELIYIGKTVSLIARMKAHKSEGRIWPKVARIEVCEVPLADLARLEGQLIHENHPSENRMCVADCYRVARERTNRTCL